MNGLLSYLLPRMLINLSFEREAYGNERNLLYLENRKKYAWFKYISNKYYKK